ncbi:hypothetical protein FQR65_LT17242 [Abscondita terminalis]|nr:hypothetical protein FQR65_LT17242 [Abscondita terminalis]
MRDEQALLEWAECTAFLRATPGATGSMRNARRNATCCWKSTGKATPGGASAFRGDRASSSCRRLSEPDPQPFQAHPAADLIAPDELAPRPCPAPGQQRPSPRATALCREIAGRPQPAWKSPPKVRPILSAGGSMAFPGLKARKDTTPPPRALRRRPEAAGGDGLARRLAGAADRNHSAAIRQERCRRRVKRSLFASPTRRTWPVPRQRFRPTFPTPSPSTEICRRAGSLDGVTKTELAEKFGPEVAELVDGLSKLDRLDFATKAEQQAESFRKMLLAMARDVRVILIKLADRLHNMRTLTRSTRESAAASRGGKHWKSTHPSRIAMVVNLLFRETCRDLVLRGHAPQRYQVLYKAVLAARGQPAGESQQDRRAVAPPPLPAAGIEARITGREGKTLCGILPQDGRPEKVLLGRARHLRFPRHFVHDPCRVLPGALGMRIKLYRPVPGKFKRLHRHSKVNGYQSLHTTVWSAPRHGRWNSSSAPATCIMWPRKASAPTSGCNRCWTSRARPRTSRRIPGTRQGRPVPRRRLRLSRRAARSFCLPRGAHAGWTSPIAIHTDIGNQAVGPKSMASRAAAHRTSSGDTVKSSLRPPVAAPTTQWLNYVRTRTRAFGNPPTTCARSSHAGNLHDAAAAPTIRPGKNCARRHGASTAREILADIGLASAWAAVVARALAPETSAPSPPRRAACRFELTYGAASAPILDPGNEGQACSWRRAAAPCPATLSSPACAWATAWWSIPLTARSPCASACANRNAGSTWAGTRNHRQGIWPPGLDIRHAANRARRAGTLAAEVTAADANQSSRHHARRCRPTVSLPT